MPIVTLTLFQQNGDHRRLIWSASRTASRPISSGSMAPAEVVTGGPSRAVVVEIDPTRMAAVGVTVGDLQHPAISQPRSACG